MAMASLITMPSYVMQFLMHTLKTREGMGTRLAMAALDELVQVLFVSFKLSHYE